MDSLPWQQPAAQRTVAQRFSVQPLGSLGCPAAEQKHTPLIRVAMIRAMLFTFLQLDYALGYLIEYSAGTGRETTHSVHLQQK